MSVKFGYSLYGESFTGEFDTREHAVQAGVTKASSMAEPPSTLYVARLVPGNPQAAGHSTDLIAIMRQRARREHPEAGSYLKTVSEQQEAELDDAVAAAILGWLKKNDMMPRFYHVEGISEHPVPMPREIEDTVSGNEVNELGTVSWGE